MALSGVHHHHHITYQEWKIICLFLYIEGSEDLRVFFCCCFISMTPTFLVWLKLIITIKAVKSLQLIHNAKYDMEISNFHMEISKYGKYFKVTAQISIIKLLVLAFKVSVQISIIKLLALAGLSHSGRAEEKKNKLSKATLSLSWLSYQDASDPLAQIHDW